MANATSTQFFGSFHKAPLLITCQFQVQSADTAGYGVTNVKGPGIRQLLMNTSATPAGYVNPSAGLIAVQLRDNFNAVFSVGWGIEASPVTGASINISSSTVLTIGNPYQIVTVGTSTQANWQAVGLPVGLTPAVGQAFLATVTGAGTGTGTVKAVGTSGISSISSCGDPSLTVAPIGLSPTVMGSWFFFQCLAPTSASVTTLIPTAPANGSIVTLRMYMGNSSASGGTAGQ